LLSLSVYVQGDVLRLCHAAQWHGGCGFGYSRFRGFPRCRPGRFSLSFKIKFLDQSRDMSVDDSVTSG
jgi:hypothetical protein